MLTATLTGNLGQDPELKYSQNGSPFLRFQVASNYRARDEHGQWVETVEWIRVTVLGARAESLGQHLRKGQRVCVVGRLEARPWVDSNDNVRAGLELTANEVDFMSSREQNSQGSGQQGQGRPQQPQSGSQVGSAQQRPQQRQQTRQGGGQRMSEWDAAHPDQDVPF